MTNTTFFSPSLAKRQERRHKSSWHAALNKRLVQMEDVEELLSTADEMLTGRPKKWMDFGGRNGDGFYIVLP